jgi:translation initiation factor 1 (eIF-1/SUI1)
LPTPEDRLRHRWHGAGRRLELQGDHREQVVSLLAKEGIRSKLAGG